MSDIKERDDYIKELTTKCEEIQVKYIEQGGTISQLEE